MNEILFLLDWRTTMSRDLITYYIRETSEGVECCKAYRNQLSIVGKAKIIENKIVHLWTEDRSIGVICWMN